MVYTIYMVAAPAPPPSPNFRGVPKNLSAKNYI